MSDHLLFRTKYNHVTKHFLHFETFFIFQEFNDVTLAAGRTEVVTSSPKDTSLLHYILQKTFLLFLFDHFSFRRIVELLHSSTLSSSSTFFSVEVIFFSSTLSLSTFGTKLSSTFHRERQINIEMKSIFALPVHFWAPIKDAQSFAYLPCSKPQFDMKHFSFSVPDEIASHSERTLGNSKF